MNRRAVLYFVLFVFAISVATGVLYRDRLAIFYDLGGTGDRYLEILNLSYLSGVDPQKIHFAALIRFISDFAAVLASIVLVAIVAYSLGNSQPIDPKRSRDLRVSIFILVAIVLSHRAFDRSSHVSQFLTGRDSIYVFLAFELMITLIAIASTSVLWRRARKMSATSTRA